MKHSWLNLRVSVVRGRQGVVAQLPTHVRVFGTQGLQHTKLHCPSPSPRVCPSSRPLNRWCHPTISSSATLFTFGLQSFPASGSFPMSQFFASGGQSTAASASASVHPVSIKGWVPLRLTGLISLLSKGLSRIFSSTTIQKHQFFGTLPSFMGQLSHSYMTTGKIIALTIQIFVSKVMSLLFNTHHLISWLQ